MNAVTKVKAFISSAFLLRATDCVLSIDQLEFGVAGAVTSQVSRERHCVGITGSVRAVDEFPCHRAWACRTF